MPIYDLFFKRKKRERGEYPDVYQYETLPQKLKVQIVHIWGETLGKDRKGSEFVAASPNRKYYEICNQILCKELGVFSLTKDSNALLPGQSLFSIISEYFLNNDDLEISLTIVELILVLTNQFLKEFRHQLKLNIEFDEVVEELNQRFREHGVGYQFENGQIIRVDSQLVHTEVVKPALQLLRNTIYRGAQEEFLKAHEHYRKSEYEDCLSECLKSFESTMMIICDKQGWQYNKKATANTLVQICLDNGLIPSFWTDHFNSLRNILTSSVATPRNKLDGHGKGNTLREVPDYLASYVLHMTASAIVFLAKAEEALV